MSRVASSLLTNVGLTDFIASSVEEYVQIAITAVTNTARLQQIRQTLPETYLAWIEQANYPQAVEDFYRSAWRTWVKSQADSTHP